MGADSGAGRPGRRRKTDERIVAAVMELLRTQGPDAVTMDAVTEKSGVAKTTLYRRYADRDEMLAGVARQIVDPQSGTAPVDTEAELSVEGLEALIRSLQNLFTAQVGSAFVGHLLTGSQAFMSTWRERLVRPQMAAMESYFRRGVEAGVLDPKVKYELIIEFILGSLVVDDAMHGRLSKTWSHDVAVTLWPTIAP